MGNEESIKAAVQTELGDDYDVEIVRNVKNNGVEVTGLSARKNGKAVAPVVYFDETAVPEKDAVRLAGIIRRAQEAPENIVDKITEFENAKKDICFKLVNTEKNEGMLESMPHREFLDLSAIYYIHLDWNDGDLASVNIANTLMEGWGVTEEELWDIAFKNTQRIFPAEIDSMQSVLCGLLGGDEDLPETDPGMLVVSNDKKCSGAAVIFYDDVLARLTDRLGDKIFILPSSVHELIAIPDTGKEDINVLTDMVRSVNRSEVSEKEFLSDNVYHYERGGEITIAS